MAVSVIEEARHRFHTQASEYLPPALADELAKDLTPMTYATGSTLIIQGSAADVVLWILSGIAKIYCLVPNGSRILLRLASTGDLLGYPTLAGPKDGVVQPFHVEALTKCTVAMFSRDSLIRTIEKLEQSVVVRLFEHFNEPWGLAAHRLVTFLGYSFRQRLELTFKNLASRFGIEDERGLLLNLKLSHLDFAEMIGSSRPMATVLIGEMVAERSLYRQGNHQYLVPRSAAIFPRVQAPALPHYLSQAKPVLIHLTSRRTRQSAASLASHLRTGPHPV
jgi:CRP-like cAMP-binding protein